MKMWDEGFIGTGWSYTLPAMHTHSCAEGPSWGWGRDGVSGCPALTPRRTGILRAPGHIPRCLEGRPLLRVRWDFFSLLSCVNIEPNHTIYKVFYMYIYFSVHGLPPSPLIPPF